jgi:Mg2+ and Co2+ transporter CorA
MNSKNYRDIALEYVEKLGEIDKIEDQLLRPENQSTELRNQLAQLKKETSNLKKQMDSSKRRKNE